MQSFQCNAADYIQVTEMISIDKDIGFRRLNRHEALLVAYA